ncbi:Reticulocalbin-2, partial [Operophtera brumata]
MDLNGDQEIDRLELKKWILSSFEEAQERMSEADDNRDGVVTWPEYLQDAFGVDSEEDIAPDDQGDSGMVFTNPEEHELMHPLLIKQTLREKDSNNDGKIDFNEFVGDRGVQQDKEWLISEKEKFDRELDINEDGILDDTEIHAWVIPDNDDRLSFDEILAHHEVFVGSEATDYGGDLMGDHFDDEL